MDTGQRISELQKRLSGTGGYDFYQSMQKAVRLYASGKNDAAIDALSKPINPVERKYNSEAFDVFSTKFGSNQSLEPISRKKTLKYADAGISITVDPPFSLMRAGVSETYCLWATQTPKLSQRYGAVACHVLRTAYGNDSLGNSSFFFSDLVAGRTYSEKQINNNTSLILAADINSIGTLVKEL